MAHSQVDTDALVDELRTSRLHAALDVVDPEPCRGSGASSPTPQAPEQTPRPGCAGWLRTAGHLRFTYQLIILTWVGPQREFG
ncbi:hypothetical protein E2561_24310 (plasmid) [Rhodococcus ruber]|nr:hypothetical protein E2561_24310 [Rhodococcus ruber]